MSKNKSILHSLGIALLLSAIIISAVTLAITLIVPAGAAPYTKVVTKQATFNQSFGCFATFHSGMRKGETVRILEVTSERGGVMDKYRIDNSKNPTWLYASAFKNFSCQPSIK